MGFAQTPLTPMEPRKGVTRRWILQGAAGLIASHAWASSVRTADSRTTTNTAVLYGQRTLPLGIRSRRIENNNGATLHILEAGFESRNRRCVVLLHGFPELAYSWRKQLLPLARAGFHVVAPDLRGYGQSAPAPVAFHDDLAPYSMLNRVSDVLGSVRAIGSDKVAAVIGHDWGSPTTQWCARLQPDVFQSVVSLNTPFLGTASLPLDTAMKPLRAGPAVDIDKDSPPSRAHASTTRPIVQAKQPMRRCGTHRKASMICSERCITSRVPTGRATSRFRSSPGVPQSLPNLCVGERPCAGEEPMMDVDG
jgi:pimeloyl-ACP methyl ester carboxylesterase